MTLSPLKDCWNSYCECGPAPKTSRWKKQQHWVESREFSRARYWSQLKEEMEEDIVILESYPRSGWLGRTMGLRERKMRERRRMHRFVRSNQIRKSKRR